jgi:hypothetical protein
VQIVFRREICWRIARTVHGCVHRCRKISGLCNNPAVESAKSPHLRRVPRLHGVDLKRRRENVRCRHQVRRLTLVRANPGVLERLRHGLERRVIAEHVGKHSAGREIESGFRHRGRTEHGLEKRDVRVLVLLNLLKDGEVARGNEPARPHTGVVEGRLQILQREREVEDVHDALRQRRVRERSKRERTYCSVHHCEMVSGGG